MLIYLTIEEFKGKDQEKNNKKVGVLADVMTFNHEIWLYL